MLFTGNAEPSHVKVALLNALSLSAASIFHWPFPPECGIRGVRENESGIFLTGHLPVPVSTFRFALSSRTSDGASAPGTVPDAMNCPRTSRRCSALRGVASTRRRERGTNLEPEALDRSEQELQARDATFAETARHFRCTRRRLRDCAVSRQVARLRQDSTPDSPWAPVQCAAMRTLTSSSDVKNHDKTVTKAGIVLCIATSGADFAPSGCRSVMCGLPAAVSTPEGAVSDPKRRDSGRLQAALNMIPD